LLVIDNCEHVLESVRHACDRLAGRVPGLRLLVTSRIPLDVGPECVRRVPPMAVPDEGGPPVATEAATLFFARAAMAGARLQAGPAELALASSICRKAAGLPLAIELVANHGAPLLAPREVNPVIATFLALRLSGPAEPGG
jgi:predicted ATPase